MSRFVAILLLGALAVVGINVGPAHAAAPPVESSYGCSLFSAAQLSASLATQSLTEANGGRPVPSNEYLQAHPDVLARSVALYKERNRSTVETWLQDQSDTCRARLVRQAQTLFWLMYTHDQARLERYVDWLVSAGPYDPKPNDVAETEAFASAQKANQEAQCQCPGVGVSVGQFSQIMGYGYTIFGAAVRIASDFFPIGQPPTTQQLATLIGAIGVTMVAVPGILNLLNDILNYNGGSAGGRNDGGDPCCCGCSH